MTQATKAVSHSRLVSGVARYAILFLGIGLALDQLGAGTQIVAVAVGAVLGGTSLALGLAFGLGGKEKDKEIIERSGDLGSGWMRITQQDRPEGGFVMKTDAMRILGMVAAVTLVAAGCGKKPESEPPATAGAMEKAGAAVDTAVEKTAEAAQKAATATKDAAGVAVEKTGEVLEKAGSAVEGAGGAMRK